MCRLRWPVSDFDMVEKTIKNWIATLSGKTAVHG